MAELILTFDWDGETVHKETKGFVGKSCTAKTKFIEEALGTAHDRKYKAVYYEEENKGSQKGRVKN